MTERESSAFASQVRKRAEAEDAAARRAARRCPCGTCQAACAMAGWAKGAAPDAEAWRSDASRACASSAQASGRQLPQVEPQPVRMVNSVMPQQPPSAAWRMSRSVTPLQRQTYTGRRDHVGMGPYSATDENDCQSMRAGSSCRGGSPESCRCPARCPAGAAAAAVDDDGGVAVRSRPGGSPGRRRSGARTAPGGAAHWHRPRA